MINNYDNEVMPLGRNRGMKFIDISVEDLDWLIGQDWLKDPLKTKIETHLKESRKSEWEGLSRD